MCVISNIGFEKRKFLEGGRWQGPTLNTTKDIALKRFDLLTHFATNSIELWKKYVLIPNVRLEKSNLLVCGRPKVLLSYYNGKYGPKQNINV